MLILKCTRLETVKSIPKNRQSPYITFMLIKYLGNPESKNPKDYWNKKIKMTEIQSSQD